MFQFYNPNPLGKLTGDCVIRAISKATNQDWDKTFIELCLQSFMMKDMPSSNSVWGAYLFNKGFRQYAVSNDCPDCFTLRDFIHSNPQGEFILGTGTHVVYVKDGTYYDSWDSGNEIVTSYWRKEN